jgi:hypothetical protein
MNYPDSGILSRNDKKQPDTKQPDFTGTLDIVCDQCGASFTRRLAAWLRESRTGRKFFSLSFKPAQQHSGDHNQHGTSMDDEDVRF